MKQQLKIHKKTKSLERSGIFDASDGVYIAMLPMQLGVKFKAPIKGQKEGLNIFLIQNKGKGPPGGWGSPVTADFPFSDYLYAVCNGSESITKTKFLSNHLIPIFKFLSQTNFYLQLNF